MPHKVNDPLIDELMRLGEQAKAIADLVFKGDLVLAHQFMFSFSKATADCAEKLARRVNCVCSPATNDEIKIFRVNKLLALKQYRTRTGLGIAPAKEAFGME